MQGWQKGKLNYIKSGANKTQGDIETYKKMKNIISIKLEKGEYYDKEHMVYQNEKLVGTVSKFCCGIDFRIKGKPNALFSIMLAMSYQDSRLKESIEAILKMEIPTRNFHCNFSHKLLTDKKKLKKFQFNLLNPGS